MASRALSAGVAYAGPACPGCGRALLREDVKTGATRCYYCGTEYEATRFDPPAPRSLVVRLATAGPSGAAACPQHPGNAAAGHCERCGILTCGLCQIEADRMRLCPACFERLSDEGALASTRVRFRDHGRVAVTMAVVGLLLLFVGVLSGPAAIFYAFRARQQREATGEPGGVGQLVLVVVLGLVQFVFGLWLIWAVVATK